MSEPKTEYLTPGQREALEAELHELEQVRRPEMVQAIKTAREFGDLSENFEYHAAKNEQGLLERRITILRSRLQHAVTVDETAHGRIGIGSRVKLEDESGERMEVEISSVGGPGAVSPDSPLGSALLGAAEGDRVPVEAPRGSWTARVLSIRPSK